MIKHNNMSFIIGFEQHIYIESKIYLKIIVMH